MAGSNWNVGFFQVNNLILSLGAWLKCCKLESEFFLAFPVVRFFLIKDVDDAIRRKVFKTAGHGGICTII